MTSEEFQAQQRNIAVLNQSVLEARAKWAEAKRKESRAADRLEDETRWVNSAYEEVESATEALVLALAEEPKYETLRGMVAKVNKSSAAHVGSSNQGKVSTHR